MHPDRHGWRWIVTEGVGRRTTTEGNGEAVDDLAPVTGWEIARARFQSGRPLPRPEGSGAPKARPSPVAPGGKATGASDREAEGQPVAKPGAATTVQ